MGSFSIWHWLIVLLIVVLVFGTKKIKNIGQDLGSAVKGFKDGMKDGTTAEEQAAQQQQQVTVDKAASAVDTGKTIDVQAKDNQDNKG